MKFLVDAQLPRRLIHRLRESGHEAKHTLDLPLGEKPRPKGLGLPDAQPGFLQGKAG